MTTVGALPAGRPCTYRARTHVLSWAPFAIVVGVHLAAKILGLDALDRSTKPLLMVALMVPIVVFGRRARSLPFVLLFGGVLFSWIGDVTLDTFVVGLSFFLTAHLVYIAMFLTTFRRRAAWWTLGYVAWFAVFVAVLAPFLGGLLVPVALYGLALGVMAAVSTRGGILTASGGLLFVASDSLLALRMFTPVMQGVAADVLIMALYLAAQTLLVAGMLRRPHD